jgi:hypothetical protein
MIECMFEDSTPDVLISEIEASQQQESALMAHRLAVVAALLSQRIAEAEEADPDPGYAMITGFARTTAEVSAAMNMSPMGASHLVAQAEALDTRLPKVAALLAEGKTDWRTVQLIIARTELVGDELIGGLDASLAERIGRWQCWSRRRIINAVDAAVRAIDPDAAKERRVRADDDRHISITPLPDGMARALTCDCGQSDCPTRSTDAEPAPGGVRTVINVIASEETLTGDSDQPGYLEGYWVIDAEQVRELAETAALRLVECPAVTREEAMRYQPSAALERWIRCRDVTCRFPGCDRRASNCDIDHTTPFNHANPAAGGLTVPWDLACYCREHHRLKTFHGGPGGWRDEQLPDGTIVWTSPTGRTYRTTPGGLDLFPQMRPACSAPKPRRRSRSREQALRIARVRSKIRDQRPVNAETRRINQARKKEIDLRKWRNHTRKMLILFKGTEPSTRPWCTWVNDPFEPELPPDWKPPPPPPQQLDDEPPF